MYSQILKENLPNLELNKLTWLYELIILHIRTWLYSYLVLTGSFLDQFLSLLLLLLLTILFPSIFSHDYEWIRESRMTLVLSCSCSGVIYIYIFISFHCYCCCCSHPSFSFASFFFFFCPFFIFPVVWGIGLVSSFSWSSFSAYVIEVFS